MYGHFTYHGIKQASMLLSNFKSKLIKLNKDLYVKDDSPTKMDGFLHAGIYLKQVKQAGLSYDVKGHGDARVEKYYAALESGQLDKYLAGVCLENIPEYDIFNAEYTKIAVPGWRTIALRLVGSKVVTLARAKKVFETASLGESDYDRLSIHGKMQFAKKLDLGE